LYKLFLDLIKHSFITVIVVKIPNVKELRQCSWYSTWLQTGVQVLVGSRISTSPYRPDRLWGPPSILSNGYQAFSPGVKRQGLEADHSSSTSVEIKKT
jgi:hypothetical protein